MPGLIRAVPSAGRASNQAGRASAGGDRHVWSCWKDRLDWFPQDGDSAPMARAASSVGTGENSPNNSPTVSSSAGEPPTVILSSTAAVQSGIAVQFSARADWVAVQEETAVQSSNQGKPSTILPTSSPSAAASSPQVADAQLSPKSRRKGPPKGVPPSAATEGNRVSAVLLTD